MDSRKLFDALLAARTEQDVVEVLERAGYWSDPSVWHNFAGQENNFSTIGNQQAHPEAALVEKLVNSIDAVLTLECRGRGVDPEDPTQAPSSIRDAVSTFFGIRDGNLAELTPTELTKLAQRIGLIATGTPKSPNLTVVDTGEGQHPDDFETTFLSLGRSNKMKIPFVQGKFNMGGTGVLQFCGKQNFQLIASKRAEELAPASDEWGFTIVRREDPSGSVRSSVYRYLAPSGRIPRFPADQLDLSLDITIPGTSALPSPSHGSVIKLYEYQLPGGAKTNILLDLFNHVAALMPGIALPIRFYERRRYQGHTLESTMIGLGARLERDTRDNLEFQPTAHTVEVEEHRLPTKVFAFRKTTSARTGKEESASAKFRDREGIVFIVNGQAHGHLEKTFFRRKRVNMSYLADDLLVLVDASNLSGRAREDLFMNSRDRLRDGTLRRSIERELEALLADHPLLKRLRQQRREQALSKRLQDDKALEDVLKSIITRSPSLSALFVTGQRLADPFATTAANDDPLEFDGQRFPSYFRLMRGNSDRDAHLGQRFRVQFETDVENLYFVRDDEPGELVLTVDGHELDAPPPNLMNGIATLNLVLPSDAQPDERLHYEGEIRDPKRYEPFTFEFWRTVRSETDRQGGTGERRPPVSKGEGNRETSRTLALPHVEPVYRADWSTYDFDRESALTVRSGDTEGFDFFVNMDNLHLRWETKASPAQADVLEAQFRYAMALVGLALLRDYDTTPDDEEIDFQDVVERTSKLLAPVVLPMINGLSDLEPDADSASESNEPDVESNEA